jgi:hypothetical protein
MSGWHLGAHRSEPVISRAQSFLGAGDRRYLRRAARHQALGPLGIALFAVLCCSIVATRLILVRHEIDEGFGDAARRFSAAALCSLPMLHPRTQPLSGGDALSPCVNRRSEVSWLSHAP